MFGAFIFGARHYADTFRTPGIYMLSDILTFTDGAPDLTVMFVINDFIFNSDMSSTAPDRYITDSIRFNDWLTVKPKNTDSTFTD